MKSTFAFLAVTALACGVGLPVSKLMADDALVKKTSVANVVRPTESNIASLLNDIKKLKLNNAGLQSSLTDANYSQLIRVLFNTSMVINATRADIKLLYNPLSDVVILVSNADGAASIFSGHSVHEYVSNGKIKEQTEIFLRMFQRVMMLNAVAKNFDAGMYDKMVLSLEYGSNAYSQADTASGIVSFMIRNTSLQSDKCLASIGSFIKDKQFTDLFEGNRIAEQMYPVIIDGGGEAGVVVYIDRITARIFVLASVDKSCKVSAPKLEYVL